MANLVVVNALHQERALLIPGAAKAVAKQQRKVEVCLLKGQPHRAQKRQAGLGTERDALVVLPQVVGQRRGPQIPVKVAHAIDVQL